MTNNLPTASDEDLLVLIQRDDLAAFAAFYDRHSTLAFSLAMRVLKDRGLAADATQEAFLGLWRHRASYAPARGVPRSWLLGIVHHRAVDMWRRERNRRGDLNHEKYLAHYPAPDRTEEQVIARAEHQNIRALLETLPSMQRRVIDLAYFGGLTHQEIASQLGLPLGTTKGRMRLGLEKLRIALRDQEALPASHIHARE